MESLAINDTTEDHDVKIARKPLKFHASYNHPSANVVLTSANDISFRVDDFHLKSASPVFRDMPSLPKKGGAIKLLDTTAVICIVLDNLTHIESKAAPSLDAMVKALDLAKKFDMKSVVIQIKAKLHGYVEGLRLLALACQQVPIDRHLARTALSQFKNFMNLDPDIFQVGLGYGVSDQTNMKTELLESLTTIGCYALSKAMRECELGKGIYGRKQHDWGNVPSEFMKALD